MNDLGINDWKSNLSIDSVIAAQAEKAKKEAQIGQNDFLTMLVAQLQQQDPLNPADSTQFASQLAQFSSLEQLVAMRQSIETLAQGKTDAGLLSRELEMTNLLGKRVLAHGNQIEVGQQGDVVIPFGLAQDSTGFALTVSRNGRDVAVLHDMGRDANGGAIQPSSGPNDLVWNGLDVNGARVPPGLYDFELKAFSPGGEIQVEPVMKGVVTGTRIEDGVPILLMGNRSTRFEDVFQVDDATAGLGSGA